MAQITAMALVSNRTQIFNAVHSSATSETYLPGDTSIHHSHTHDEPLHPELGYQVVSDKLATAAIPHRLHVIDSALADGMIDSKQDLR